MQEQAQIKKTMPELEDFKKMHSETFMYFLEEYEKWRAIKQKKASQESI